MCLKETFQLVLALSGRKKVIEVMPVEWSARQCARKLRVADERDSFGECGSEAWVTGFVGCEV